MFHTKLSNLVLLPTSDQWCKMLIQHSHLSTQDMDILIQITYKRILTNTYFYLEMDLTKRYSKMPQHQRFSTCIFAVPHINNIYGRTTWCFASKLQMPILMLRCELNVFKGIQQEIKRKLLRYSFHYKNETYP